MSEAIISGLRITFNHEDVGTKILRNSHLSAQECARRHMSKDSSCRRFSALSPRNWNCVEGECPDQPHKKYCFETWCRGFKPKPLKHNQACCLHDRRISYQIVEGRKVFASIEALYLMLYVHSLKNSLSNYYKNLTLFLH